MAEHTDCLAMRSAMKAVKSECRTYCCPACHQGVPNHHPTKGQFAGKDITLCCTMWSDVARFVREEADGR